MLPSSQVRVLVVDDDPAICEYMQVFLTRDGIGVTTETDPTRVPDVVREGDFHLVVLDLMMPKMDGLELLEQLRKLDSDLAVVIFTGFPDFESAVQAMKHDVVDYLRKPFNPDEFRAVLDKVMKRKGLLRSPEEQLHRHIGDCIRTRRKAEGLTLKQLSRRTGLSVSLLSQIERAESSASIGSLYKIASALDTRISALFGEF